LCGFLEIEHCHKKRSLSFTFYGGNTKHGGKHEIYLFLDGFSGYHQIMIAPPDMYKIAFITDWGMFAWIVTPFGLKNILATYQWAMSMAFCEYLKVFMKLFLDDFNVFNDLNTHLAKLWLCFDKCREFNIGLNPKKCMFLVYSRVRLGYVISKVGKLPNLINILAIVNMPALKTRKDIQVFNAMTQFY
jgi:hypothetical protein